jgi:hypothetical protein
MAAKKEIFQKVGGFDENFLFTHADGDFFIRARKAGYKLIFDPKVIVWHHVNPRGATRAAYYQGRDFAYFYMKSIRPRSLPGWLRYMLNIVYFNFYWLHKTWKTGNVGFLKGVQGFLHGLEYYMSSHQSY